MGKYTGLYTFDVDNHRFIPVGQADGIIDCFEFNLESKEPLIKDEKVRKAVRAWADVRGTYYLKKQSDYSLLGFECDISFTDKVFSDLEYLKEYTIAELCGEEEE